MGWGTFVAGRVLRQRRPTPGALDAANEVLDNFIKNETNVQLEVLEEINRLKALGIDIDMQDVRSDVRKRRQARRKMGNSLKLSIVLRAQEKTLAGEPVNYEEIEREILAEYKPINWERYLKKFFPDYYRAKRFLVKFLNNRREIERKKKP